MKLRSVWLLVVAMLIVPVSAFAQNWYYVGDGQNGKVVRLVDKDSIRKSGFVVKVWTLTLLRDYEPRLRNGNSIKQQWQYDCKNESKTMFYQTTFRDGEVVFSDNPQVKTSEPVIPGSLDSLGFEFACGKKSKAIDLGNPTESDMRSTFFGQ